MKKLLFGAIILCFVVFGFYLLATNQSSKNPSVTISEVFPLREGDENEQEELELRAHEEFIKTVDPKLGYVPTERLIEGERRAAEIMASLGNTPNSVTALTWTERGPNNIGGRTRGFIFDANDATGNTALAGAVGGGLWRTTNFKTGSPITWTRITSISQNLAISTIAQDPQTLNTMYAGTGEGYNNADAIRGLGVYKSTDAGLTWTLLAETTTGGVNVDHMNFVQKIIVYNNATHDVYAACASRFCNLGGLMKSINGGTNWTRVLGTTGAGCGVSSPDTKIYDIERSLSGDLWVTSSTVNLNPSGKIWRSPAGATVGNAGTWVDKTPTGSWRRIEIACSPSDNNRVYALLQANSNAVGGIRRTDDGAATPASSWVTVNNTTAWCDQGTLSGTDFSRNQAWYDLMIAIKPDDDATVFVGGVDIMRTTNGTNATPTYTQLTQWASGCTTLPYVHADIHTITYLPGSSTEFVVACDGGLFYTSNGGTSFVEKNTGYNVTQYYSAAIHPTAGSNYMLAGSQDNGTHKFTSAGMNTVTTPTGGDGGFADIDQKNPLQQLTNYTQNQMNASNNGGSSFTFLGGFASDRFINPGELDTATTTTPGLSTAAIYYCGGATQRFRRGVINFSGTPAYTSLNDFVIAASTTNHAVSAIKVDPNTPNRVWVAMSQASGAAAVAAPQLYYVNSANTATPVANAVTLPAAVATNSNYISSIDVDKGNASHILITLSNYGVQSVWESTDLGANWTSLDNNGVNLPDVPVRWGMFIPSGITQTPASPAATNGILIATELGVWGATTSSGTTTAWAQNGGTMGNVRVDMLKRRGVDNVVVAATHGRGLFTAQLIALPVNFVWFKGMPLNNSNKLNWKVGNSINNKGFEIERKYEGESTFSNIGFVPVPSSGSPDIEYSYEDRNLNLSKQVATYRLKQVDLDGRSKYSDQLAIKRSQLGKMIYYVSADKNNLFVRAGNRPGISNVSVSIFDSQGKVLLSRTEKYQDMNFNISAYPSGVYYVKIKSMGTGEESVERFLK
jgi:Secretion system C-terminal sorting domain